MRILHLNGRSDFGGGPKNVYRLLRGIDPERFRLFVACPDEAPYFDKLAHVPHLRVFPLPLRRLRLSNLWELARIVRRYGIDCVHSQGKAAGLWGRALKCLFPHLVVVHHYRGLHYRHYPGLFQGVYLLLERMLSLFTTRVIHVSASEQAEAQGLRLCAVDKQVLIPNGVETFSQPPLSRHEARRRLGLSDFEPVCITVARYSKQKNLLASFDVIARLRDMGVPVRFLVVGGDDEQGHDDLERSIRRRQLASAVTLLGAREDVIECLCAADVYLSTSRWEGLPTSVLEAMSVGLPVVASDVTGNQSVLRSESGFLIHEADVEGFARAVARLARDPELRARMGAAGSKRVVDEFSIQRMVQAHEDLYTQLLRARGPAARAER